MDRELDDIIEYYKGRGAPSDQCELTELLKEVQSENGGALSLSDISYIGEKLNKKPSSLMALIKRISAIKVDGRHILEVCSGPNCSKKADFYKMLDSLDQNKITVKYTLCMRMCKDGPNIKFDGKVYNHVDASLIKKLTENLL